VDVNEHWKTQTAALGTFIRAQRRLADLSLRELSTMTKVSNAYLSQVERGLHQPSVRVLGAIAQALNVPPDELLAEAGFSRHDRPGAGAAPAGTAASSAAQDQDIPTTEAAIRADPALTDEQRQALIGVYRSFVAQQG
jgi:transcriptional regulator with XRE-family HTH domain